jgi:prefoldin alpha subunit
MSNAHMSDDAQQKVTEYSLFIENTLRPNLSESTRARDEVLKQLNDFLALQRSVKDMLKTDSHSGEVMADVAYERVYCRAKIDDHQTVFVHVGYGFHVELKTEEALLFTKRRIDFLTQKLQYRKERVIQMEEHTARVQHLLEEIKQHGL